MARDWQNSLVDCIDDPLFLREEDGLHLGRWCDPVAGANDGYRSIQVVKGQLADVGGHRVQK